MKRNHFTSSIGETIYHLNTTPIRTININEFVEAISRLNVILDEYTYQGIYNFYKYGFTESRVSNAPRVTDADQMILFSYDDSYTSPVGLAICFNSKFYSLPFSKGKRAESELHKIFINKKYIKQSWWI